MAEHEHERSSVPEAAGDTTSAGAAPKGRGGEVATGDGGGPAGSASEGRVCSIVVMGVAGCGKTSVGVALAQQLKWPFVEGDAHHAPASIAKMQAGQPLTDDDRWGWLDRLGTLLAAPGPLVLSCSALKRVYRDRLRAACPTLQFVYIEIDRALALARVTARAAGHIFPASLVESQFATLESPVGEAGVITVPASAPLDQQLAAIANQRVSLAKESGV